MATGWILKELPLSELKDHPVNLQIYGSHEADDEMVASIKEFGVLEPLRCTKDHRLLSGHRRKANAKAAKLKTAPVLVCRTVLSEAEQVCEIVESNRQREKTMEQRAREYSQLAEAKAELARKRQASGLRRGSETPVASNLTEREKGRAKEQAAAEVGMSRNTAEKAREVVKEIDKAEASGDDKRAAELRDKLNNESVSKAHRAAVPAREPGEDPPETQHRGKPKEGNRKLDFDDEVIDQHFGKLIRAVDDRAAVLGRGAGHKACIADLRAFAQSWKAWRKETRK